MAQSPGKKHNCKALAALLIELLIDGVFVQQNTARAVREFTGPGADPANLSLGQRPDFTEIQKQAGSCGSVVQYFASISGSNWLSCSAIVRWSIRPAMSSYPACLTMSGNRVLSC